MNKLDFIEELAKRTENLPQREQNKFIEYYCEIISERMEDGMTEEQAIEALGPIDEIVQEIMMEAPLATVIKDKVKSAPKPRLRAWEIVLIVLGSPIWLSIGIALLAVIFALYVVLWAVVICLFAVFAAFVASAAGCLAASVVAMVFRSVPEGMLLIGVALILAALGIFMFLLGKVCAKAVVKLVVVIVRGIKSRIVKGSRKEQKNEKIN